MTNSPEVISMRMKHSLRRDLIEQWSIQGERVFSKKGGWK